MAESTFRTKRLSIAEGVTAPAYIMVPLSEGNDLDRWLFNDAAEFLLGRDCGTTAEVLHVFNFGERMTDQFEENDVIDVNDRDIVRAFHHTLISRVLARVRA